MVKDKKGKGEQKEQKIHYKNVACDIEESRKGQLGKGCNKGGKGGKEARNFEHAPR